MATLTPPPRSAGNRSGPLPRRDPLPASQDASARGEAPGVAPGVAPGGQAGGRLPVPLTSLIGREAEITSLCARLPQPDVRLLTLSGPPGTGKTRLGPGAGMNLSQGRIERAHQRLADPRVELPVGQWVAHHRTPTPGTTSRSTRNASAMERCRASWSQTR